MHSELSDALKHAVIICCAAVYAGDKLRRAFSAVLTYNERLAFLAVLFEKQPRHRYGVKHCEMHSVNRIAILLGKLLKLNMRRT